MKNSILLFLLLFTITSQAQLYNDSSFNANVVHPKFMKGYGPKILIDAGHNNFAVELGLNKPLFDVASSDGYQIKIDSMQFTKEYLSNYNIVVIWPAMPFKFGSKNQVTDEITFTIDELDALHDWVSNGGSLLMFSEHAPIDKSVTPLFNKFGFKPASSNVFLSFTRNFLPLIKNFSVTLSTNCEFSDLVYSSKIRSLSHFKSSKLYEFKL